MSKRNNKDCNGDNLNLNNKKLKVETNNLDNIQSNTPLNQKDEKKTEDGKKVEVKKVEKEIVKLNEKIETFLNLISSEINSSIKCWGNTNVTLKEILFGDVTENYKNISKFMI